jgi:ubiquinone/menaquinone biosynthesis C-methylase UbiE
LGFYDKYILPKAIHFVCKQKPITYQSKKAVPLAKGNVLEIGVGSGLNFPFYNSNKVEHVWGLDTNKQILKIAKKRASKVSFGVEFIYHFIKTKYGN